ncbi:hypothetical protein B0H10DRAFT_1957579 [Mycena sp. CBHHK59/15]|nr:hypothetical protein B0H10DRAFT_1957579 [Mycena sp. CBHHK59/15]
MAMMWAESENNEDETQMQHALSSSASSRFSTFSTFPNPELNLGSGSDLPAVQNLTAAILGQRQSQPICGHKMTTLRVQSEQESESSLTCTFKKFKTGFQK